MKKLKAFTLVEMLLVIVIIGVLMGALIPNLMGTRSLAEDTARLSNLRDYDSALQRYRLDNSSYPTSCSALSEMKSELSNYMKEFPQDPNETYVINYQDENEDYEVITGDYLYCPLKYKNIPNAGYILVAKLSSYKKSNIGSGDLHNLNFGSGQLYNTYSGWANTIVRDGGGSCTSDGNCYYMIASY